VQLVVKEGTDDALLYKTVEHGAGDIADHYADK